jgi:hypothetical protein
MRRRPRLTSASFEELLDGGRVADAGLSRVISAARAPADPGELAGFDAARAAFDRTCRAPNRRPVSSVPAATRTAAGRLLAIKAIAAVAGATLVGGAAYAASNTQLLGGGSPHHGPSRPAPNSGSPTWNPGGLAPGPKATAAGNQPSDHRSKPHPSPSNGFGSSVAASARAGDHAAPTPTRRPSSTPSHAAPSPTLPGNAKTTPPARPTDHPSPTRSTPAHRH